MPTLPEKPKAPTTCLHAKAVQPDCGPEMRPHVSSQSNMPTQTPSFDQPEAPQISASPICVVPIRRAAPQQSVALHASQRCQDVQTLKAGAVSPLTAPSSAPSSAPAQQTSTVQPAVPGGLGQHGDTKNTSNEKSQPELKVPELLGVDADGASAQASPREERR